MEGRIPRAEALAVLKPILPTDVLCVMPTRVLPRGLIPIQLTVPSLGDNIHVQPLAVRMNGVPARLVSDEFGMLDALLFAPDQESQLAIEIDWELVLGVGPTGHEGETILIDGLRSGVRPSEELFVLHGTAQARVDVTVGWETVPPYTGPMDERRLAASVVGLYVTELTAFTEPSAAPAPTTRDLVGFTIRAVDGVVMDGTWTIDIDGTWTRLDVLPVRTKLGAGLGRAFRALVPRPNDAWPPQLRVRYEPRQTSWPYTLAPVSQTASDRDRWRSIAARTVRGVWRQPFELTLIRPEEPSGTATPDAGVHTYRVQRESH